MASTYSDLKIELIGTGEQTGTWGTTTNNNFSIAFQEAITGSADVAFSSADVTLTLTDTNAAQTARNLRLNLTGTSGGARNLILGSGCQIEKLYLINNGLADAVTVKNTTGTGVVVAAGKSMFVFNNGTNVVDVTTYLSSLTLGTALPIASGGTGQTTASAAFNALSPITTTGDLIIGNGSNSATRLGIGTNGFVLTSNGTTATWAASTGGVTSFSAGTTGLTPNTTTTGAITLAGTLAIANGGTGQTTASSAFNALSPITTTGDLIIGNGTNSATRLGIGTNGFVLTSNGTTATWAAVTPTGSTYTRTSFTATGGQTTFTVSYTVGFIQVFLNGVLLNGTDFTATNGTSVVLATGATAGDIVETIAFTVTNVSTASSATNIAGGLANQVPYQSAPGTTVFSSNLTFNGTTLTVSDFTDSSLTAGRVVYAGTGGNLTNSASLTFDGTTLVTNSLTTTGTLREKQVAVAASNIDLTLGNYFTRTISGTTTFTVSNVPSSGTAASFILDLTNGGSATVNWWSGVKWAGGTAPTLTSSGRDALGFYTYDGGTTWTGLVLGKDIK